ncbi:ADP-ribosylation factor-binding protein GGA1 [Anabrus simplex]|uniref:ADP-ribosylation factor-binding protein GGA1 n=1 Tax=Anabrus simplex TaxID=316456 RepID=UPI0035A2D276
MLNANMDEDMDVRESVESLISSVTTYKGSIMPKAVEVINLLSKTPHAVPIAVRVMATKIQSPKEQEAMHALALLDLCMKECGANFQAEVGKFRFLNELIKLVSPKYLGGRTSPQVRQKVLNLLYTWTKDYSHETKILEAYDMLKKQGVISKDDPVYGSPKCEESAAAAAVAAAASRSKSIFEDDERSRLLQKLLQSKNPDDLQAANRLIKTMVKEDERRAELNARRSIELESVRNNAKLLCEMLASYRPGKSSDEELELIKEVHQSCERLRPLVIRLASETQDNDKMLGDVLNASDLLASSLDKYTLVIEQGLLLNSPSKTDSLLDLSTPNEEKSPSAPVTWLHDELQDLDLDKNVSSPADTASQQSSIEVLGDIFGPLAPNESSAPAAAASVAIPVFHAEPSILQPVSLLVSTGKKEAVAVAPAEEQKPKGFTGLDLLGEFMLQDNLPPSHGHQSSSSGSPMKYPDLPPRPRDSQSSHMVHFFREELERLKHPTPNTMEQINGGDPTVDISHRNTEPLLPINLLESAGDINAVQSSCGAVGESGSAGAINQDQSCCGTVTESEISEEVNKDNRSRSDHDSKRVEVKSLADVSVSLDSIKPGSIPPHPILDEKNGLSVVLHFARDAPRPDVSVIVVTTINRNTEPVSSFLFQAVVPKTCRLRLLPPSGSDLPAHNPFLPPSAITQVMLIANPNKDPVSLKYMISYTLDGETTTEMGEVEELPMAT